MKIYKVDFEPMCPVPYGLIIAAKNIEDAKAIAQKTIEHTTVGDIEEIPLKESKVLFYESGDY